MQMNDFYVTENLLFQWENSLTKLSQLNSPIKQSCNEILVISIKTATLKLFLNKSTDKICVLGWCGRASGSSDNNFSFHV